MLSVIPGSSSIQQNQTAQPAQEQPRLGANITAVKALAAQIALRGAKAVGVAAPGAIITAGSCLAGHGLNSMIGNPLIVALLGASGGVSLASCAARDLARADGPNLRSAAESSEAFLNWITKAALFLAGTFGAGAALQAEGLNPGWAALGAIPGAHLSTALISIAQSARTEGAGQPRPAAAALEQV